MFSCKIYENFKDCFDEQLQTTAFAYILYSQQNFIHSINSEKHDCEAVVHRCSVKKVFSCEFYKISKNTFFYSTPSVAASELCE